MPDEDQAVRALAAENAKLKEALANLTAERDQQRSRAEESEVRYRDLFESMLHGFAYHEMIFDDGGRPVD